jgi:putative FmdB family regulatory protein
MPIYEYECLSCQHPFDALLSVANRDEPQPCPECGGESKKVISAVRFNLPGDDFPGKNNRIAGQMKDKNKRLTAKQNQAKRDGKVPSLVPNVEGEQTKDWKDATKLAKSKGKDTTGYDRRARVEKG